MNARDIYDVLILEGKQVSIPFPNRTEFETLRRYLYSQHKLMVDIGGTTLSLTCSFNPEKSIAIFGLTQRIKRDYQITIIDPTDEVKEDGTQIRPTLGEASKE